MGRGGRYPGAEDYAAPAHAGQGAGQGGPVSVEWVDEQEFAASLQSTSYLRQHE